MSKQPYEKSLLNDIMRAKGRKIVDVYGYIAYDFGDPVFKITRIDLGDMCVHVEGEHDCPYIVSDDDDRFDLTNADRGEG